MTRRPLGPAVALLAALALTVGCGEPWVDAGADRSPQPGGAPTAVPTPASTAGTTPGSTTSPTPTPTSTPDPPTCGERLAARMSLRQRAGQLVMVGLNAGSSGNALGGVVRSGQLGGVVLLGHWDGADIVSRAAEELQAAAPGRAGLLIAVDQEGGLVQHLSGPGFSTIPPARDRPASGVRAGVRNSQVWARELAEAGVNVNFAPVADTVPAELGSGNEPIGALSRDFVPGSPARNAEYVAASVRGSLRAGVAPTLKHFPGIGRITGNTDHAATGIEDPTTTPRDPYLQPFAAGIEAGAPVVMASSATYPKIDPTGPAMFSTQVLTDLLRGRLGFDGVVVSDDVGAAAAVASVPVGERATRFVAAGGDLVLTADAALSDTLIDAIVTRGRTRPRFAETVERSAGRVLDLKVDLGLAGC